jgi:hypothetical protein
MPGAIRVVLQRNRSLFAFVIQGSSNIPLQRVKPFSTTLTFCTVQLIPRILFGQLCMGVWAVPGEDLRALGTCCNMD